MALGSWLLALACCVEAVKNGHWGFPRPFFFLAFSQSFALQSTDFLEVRQRCIGAWGSPLLLMVFPTGLLQPPFLLLLSFFVLSFLSSSSFFSSSFSPFSLSLPQHSMYLSQCMNFASSRLWTCCRTPLIIYIYIYGGFHFVGGY